LVGAPTPNSTQICSSGSSTTSGGLRKRFASSVWIVTQITENGPQSAFSGVVAMSPEKFGRIWKPTPLSLLRIVALDGN
jgi:hypothetical protein